MRKMPLIRIVTLLLAITLMIPLDFVFALSTPVPTLQQIKDEAALNGIDSIEKWLGAVKYIKPSAPVPANDAPYIRLDAEPPPYYSTPLGSGWIRVPAGEQILITAKFSTVGELYGTGSCCGGDCRPSPTSYREAVQPSSVTYSLPHASLSGSLERTFRETISNDVTLEDCDSWSCNCDESGCDCCCDTYSFTRCRTTRINYEFRQIVDIPDTTLDANSTNLTININADRITDVSCDIPGATVNSGSTRTVDYEDSSSATVSDSVTITIPVQVYTPIRNTFRLKKFFDPLYPNVPDISHGC